MFDLLPEGVTELLRAASRGDSIARQQLWSMIYDELHRRAAAQLAGDAIARHMQPTTLVHEAYLRIVGDAGDESNGGGVNWTDRRHFFAAAAEIMRHIRVDYARKCASQKRGGRAPSSLPETVVASFHDNPSELLGVDEALERLKKLDACKAQIVELRFFAELTVAETAELLGISPRLVEKEWQFARKWLYVELCKGDTRA